MIAYVDLVSKKEYSYWSEHPKFTDEDWKNEVLNSDTRKGYWDWVRTQQERKESLDFQADEEGGE